MTGELGRNASGGAMLRSAAIAQAFAFAALSFAPVGAHADDEAIPTAAGITPPDASKAPPPGPLQPLRPSNLAPVQPGPCGSGPVPKLAPVGADGEPAVDRSPHGELSVGVGTRGYRSVEGAVCLPIGETGFVALDLGTAQFGRR
jgi:hypothetical protein